MAAGVDRQVAIGIAEQAAQGRQLVTDTVNPVRGLLQAREERILKKLELFTRHKQDQLASNVAKVKEALSELKANVQSVEHNTARWAEGTSQHDLALHQHSLRAQLRRGVACAENLKLPFAMDALHFSVESLEPLFSEIDTFGAV